MRITADVVARARAFINPVKDRELDLRGYKIPLIENLGTTQDQFDVIDLSDNEIKRLDNFPRLKRLRTLLLSNNFISRIGADLGDQIAGLESLVLTNNKIASLSELDHLAGLNRLTSLSLLDNPVARQQHYRAYVIHRVPSLKVLDFSKVKLEERKTAAKLFRSEAGRKLEAAVAQEGKALAEEAHAQEQQQQQQQQQDGQSKGALTDEQKRIAAAMIDSAKTPEELDRVERMLKAGIFRLPDGVSLPPAAPEPVSASAPAKLAPPAPAPAAAPAAVAVPARAPAPAPAPPAPTPPPAPAKAAVVAPPPPVQQDEEEPMDVDDEAASGANGENAEELTEGQIAKMKVVELKEELKKRGLSVNGLKQELVERLKAHVQSN